MDSSSHLAISVTAALVNVVLSLVLPVLLKNSKLPFAAQVRETYKCNRDVILISAILTIIFVYIALQINPMMEEKVYSRLAQLLNPREVTEA